MIKQLEAKYTIFDSVESMLSPDNLSEITQKTVTQVTETPIEEHRGLSGAQLSHVDTDNGRFFMKHMSHNTNSWYSKS